MNSVKDSHARIRKLIGDVTPEQLVHVESFTGVNVGVFIPSTGHCLYAISADHTHPSYSFYYSYNNKSRMIVDGKIVQSRPGYISALSPGVKHSELPAERFIRFYAILIDPDFFMQHAAIYKKEIRPEMLKYIKMPEQLMPCIRNFMVETSEKTAGSDEVVQSLEVQIVHHILRSIFSIRINSGKITERADIDYVVEYINDNFACEFTLDDLASKIALSRSHFSRLFKKETGYTLQNYIIKVRLERAKLLLTRGNVSITEIAHKCGFSSSAHFTSSFVKNIGVRPSVYRKDASM